MDNEINSQQPQRRRKGWFPVLLLLVGIFGLLANYGFINPQDWVKLWPLVLIIPAIVMLARPKH